MYFLLKIFDIGTNYTEKTPKIKNLFHFLLSDHPMSSDHVNRRKTRQISRNYFLEKNEKKKSSVTSLLSCIHTYIICISNKNDLKKFILVKIAST